MTVEPAKDLVMLSVFLKSKLHLLSVTSADLEYEGSLALDPAFMDAAGIKPYEKILVANRNNGKRFETYAIPGEPGSGVVCLNGAAAHKGKPGDRIIVFTFCMLTDDEIAANKPRIAVFNEKNEIIRVK